MYSNLNLDEVNCQAKANFRVTESGLARDSFKCHCAQLVPRISELAVNVIVRLRSWPLYSKKRWYKKPCHTFCCTSVSYHSPTTSSPHFLSHPSTNFFFRSPTLFYTNILYLQQKWLSHSSFYLPSLSF